MLLIYLLWNIPLLQWHGLPNQNRFPLLVTKCCRTERYAPMACWSCTLVDTYLENYYIGLNVGLIMSDATNLWVSGNFSMEDCRRILVASDGIKLAFIEKIKVNIRFLTIIVYLHKQNHISNYKLNHQINEPRHYSKSLGLKGMNCLLGTTQNWSKRREGTEKTWKDKLLVAWGFLIIFLFFLTLPLNI